MMCAPDGSEADTYLNAKGIGLQESMQSTRNSEKLAQTDGGWEAEEERSDPVTESEVEVPPGFMSGGVDGTRTRGLRRDRPAF